MYMYNILYIIVFLSGDVAAAYFVFVMYTTSVQDIF